MRKACAAGEQQYISICVQLSFTKFPVLLEKVLYDGTHTGDWISSKVAAKLLKEVDIVLHSSDILSDSEKEFFTNMKQLSEASIATGNPIMF